MSLTGLEERGIEDESWPELTLASTSLVILLQESNFFVCMRISAIFESASIDDPIFFVALL